MPFVHRLADSPAQVVFCDGGYTRSFAEVDCRNKSLFAVGDFDSSKVEAVNGRVAVYVDTDENRNDLEKALDLLDRQTDAFAGDM